MKRANGFSLVELLIVMMVLGVLIAILVPNMRGAGSNVQSDAQLQSVLLTAGQEMERYAMAHNTYVAPGNAVPGLDVPSGLSVRVVSADASMYCIEAYATGDTSNTFSMFAGDGIQAATCSER